MLKASSVSETARRGRRNDRHVSRVDKLSIKYLQGVNVHDDLVIVHSVWTGTVRGTVRTLLTHPLTALINRPPCGSPTGVKCAFITEFSCTRDLHSLAFTPFASPLSRVLLSLLISPTPVFEVKAFRL
jgi:hypothetical protein